MDIQVRDEQPGALRGSGMDGFGFLRGREAMVCLFGLILFGEFSIRNFLA